MGLVRILISWALLRIIVALTSGVNSLQPAVPPTHESWCIEWVRLEVVLLFLRKTSFSTFLRRTLSLGNLPVGGWVSVVWSSSSSSSNARWDPREIVSKKHSVKKRCFVCEDILCDFHVSLEENASTRQHQRFLISFSCRENEWTLFRYVGGLKLRRFAWELTWPTTSLQGLTKQKKLKLLVASTKLTAKKK